jgi:membrane protein
LANDDLDLEAVWTIGRRIRRALVIGWRATGRGVTEFYNSNNLTYASSIAYYALLSLFPFLLILLAIFGRIAVGQAGGERVLMNLLEAALPSNFEFLSEQVVELQRAPIPLTIVGTIVSLWASMGVFSAVTAAVDHAWGTDKPRSYLAHQRASFVMMMAAGVLLVVALGLISAVQASETRVFATLESEFPWMGQLSGAVSRLAFMPLSILAVGLIYYHAPNTKVRLRDVWFGAVLSAVLWRLALEGFSWYLRDFARLSVHGSISTVIAFLLWVYLSAVILLYGVEVTAAYAHERKKIRGERSKVKGQR